MGSAKHLTVALVGSTVLAPSLNMVGIHFRQLPNLLFIGIMTYGAKRTVTDMLLLCFCRLAVIDSSLSVFVKHSNIQQFGIITAAKYKLKYIFLVADTRVLIQPFYFC